MHPTHSHFRFWATLAALMAAVFFASTGTGFVYAEPQQDVAQLLGLSPTCMAACGFNPEQTTALCTRLRTNDRTPGYLAALAALRQAEQLLATTAKQPTSTTGVDVDACRTSVTNAKATLASAADSLWSSATAECTPEQQARLTAWRSADNSSLPPELRIILWDAPTLQAIKRALLSERRTVSALTAEDQSDRSILADAKNRTDVVDAKLRLSSTLATLQSAMQQ